MVRYALVIGIEVYNDEYFPMLTNALRDAHAVADMLRKDNRYENVQLETHEITQKKIVATLKQFFEKAEHNEALIYFTGHGFQSFDCLDKPIGYLATEECTITFEDGKIKEPKGGLPFNSLSELISDSKLSNLVLLLDSCHSGFFIETGLTQRHYI